MVTRAEAERERTEAMNDIREEGAPVVVRFDRSYGVNPPGRERPAEDWVEVRTWALFESGTYLDEGGGAMVSDAVVYLADKGLRQLEGLASLPMGGAPAGSGYRMLVGPPLTFPVAGADGVRELQLLQVLDTTKVGGWDVLHKVRARG